MITTIKKSHGFTLVELMIVVAIVAILAMVAYPSYTEYVQRGNRTEGQALLSDTAAAQERYYAQNFTYITNTADIAKLNTRDKSSTGKYTLSLGSAANDGGYTLTATQQFNDTKCGNLTLTATGTRGRSATGGKSIEDCWR
ncbi:MAG: pilus assembly protein PilE [Gammaproteobacteria bacterium HGW-Gammaproteobacteria-13]|nr:MAG: pilus assembly protein PilE [Gammaproteobacteria bacterium HGW-Gammaproteobacteria-13]